MILRDHDTNGDGTYDARHYVHHDANYNTTSLTDDAGDVVERFIYDPYGQPTVLDPNWSVDTSGSGLVHRRCTLRLRRPRPMDQPRPRRWVRAGHFERVGWALKRRNPCLWQGLA